MKFSNLLVHKRKFTRARQRPSTSGVLHSWKAEHYLTKQLQLRVHWRFPTDNTPTLNCTDLQRGLRSHHLPWSTASAQASNGKEMDLAGKSICSMAKCSRLGFPDQPAIRTDLLDQITRLCPSGMFHRPASGNITSMALEDDHPSQVQALSCLLKHRFCFATMVKTIFYAAVQYWEGLGDSVRHDFRISTPQMNPIHNILILIMRMSPVKSWLRS